MGAGDTVELPVYMLLVQLFQSPKLIFNNIFAVPKRPYSSVVIWLQRRQGRTVIVCKLRTLPLRRQERGMRVIRTWMRLK